MTATVVPSGTGVRALGETAAKGHIGLLVLGTVVSTLLLGLVLVLFVCAAGPEHQITGAALVALGFGFAVLARASKRFTDQPQPWALLPGLASAAVGLAVWVIAPGDRMLALAGWVWPALLLVLVGWSIRGARRDLRNWSRAAVLYPAFFLLLLVAGGGVVETVVEATSANPPPAGRTYLVNGHRLYLSCVGEGTPTVVLLNGQAERTPSWAWVQQGLSASTRVCAYDRAGQGWSGGTPGTQEGRQLTADLHGLLRAARVHGPYVLAGHSVGGVYALLYAAHYPEQVAGLALIDSATPYQFDLPDYPGFYAMWRRGSALLPSLARVGLVRMATGSGFAGLPSEARNAARAFAASPRELRADRIEFAQLPRMFDETKAVTDLGELPIRVVTASVGTPRGWTAAQGRLAKLSTRGAQRTVAGATHAALVEDERFASITSRSIAQVVRSARTGE